MKRVFKFSLAACTVLCAIGYLAACFTPFISPRLCWPMSFLALGFPYLSIGIILLTIVWLIARKKIGIFLLILLFIGYQNIFSTIGIHFFSKPVARPSGTLRIMTWNVRGFDNPSAYMVTPGSVRQRMFDYIRDSAPDVICIQEFLEHRGHGLISNTTELLDMGYNYYYRTDESVHQHPWGLVLAGTAIFSKIPIFNTGKKMFPDSSYPEHIVFIDVKMNGKPLRIYSTHFKSLNLGAVLLDSNSRASFYGDSNIIYTANQFEKLKIFPQDHVLQSRIAKQFINQSPYPLMFCGDLNSVPTSYPYHIISQGLQDAFLQKGFGLGTTMDSLPKNLRIDFMLADKKINIENYQKNNLNLSDHFPQMIDISWKKD